MCILEGQRCHQNGKCPGTPMFYTTLFDETNLGVLGLSRGPGHATPENFENGASQIGYKCISCL